MLAFTIAHVSVVKMRYSRARSDRPYRTPFSVRLRGGELPLLAVFGAIVCSAGWVATMVVHEPARYVGLGWMLAGIALYVVYRRADQASLLRRVTVPAEALRAEHLPEREYGSILVPLCGTRLDEDIVQTAALLAAGKPTDDAEIDSSTIEAVWIFEMPMSLPLDARLPDAQVKHARQALARAKAVGEEYTGVQVATATIRARRAGQAILEEARRRGVEAIVLGAEEPSRIRGGSRLGDGVGRSRTSSATSPSTWCARPSCRVIVTAPSARRAKLRGAERLGAPRALPSPSPPGRAAARTVLPRVGRGGDLAIDRADDSASHLAHDPATDPAADRSHVHADRRRRPRRLGRRQVGPCRRARSVRARRGPSLARAPGRRPARQLGGSRRSVHAWHRARDRCARSKRGSSAPTCSSLPPTATTPT